MINRKIVTVGFCPCWDTVCRVDGINWGEHKQVAAMETYPAGKALNISQALRWMGAKSTAAGLWGRGDLDQMMYQLAPYHDKIEIRFTPVEGKTRENITIIDEKNMREIHLRATSELATKKSLRHLDKDLDKIAGQNSICVFSGSMPPDKSLPDVLSIIRHCRQRGAEVVVDTSGSAFRQIVAQGGLLLIKPNVEELKELIDEGISDTIKNLVGAARELLDKVEIVLVSRGEKGAVVVSKDEILEARCLQRPKVATTVGCGDYLLAGFLMGLNETCDVRVALETAIRSATARARGWMKENWANVSGRIKVRVQVIK